MMRKPKVVILGTGGTIAGKAGSNTEMTGYQAGEIGIQTLINAVPEMLEVADVTGEQFCNIGSFDMIDDIWLRLSRRVSELLQQPEVDGIVITHGTDTLEETAYFLDTMELPEIAVVITGAMRSSNELGSDGVYNFLTALRVAADPKARDKGVLVVMNDEIHAAKYVTKTHTTNVSTFQTPTHGPLGLVMKKEILFFKTAEPRVRFDLDTIDGLVPIIATYAGMKTDLLDMLDLSKLDGLIIQAFGAGNIPKETAHKLQEFMDAGLPIALVSRCFNGIAEPVYAYEGGGVQLHQAGVFFIKELNAPKARIKLLIALNAGLKGQELKDYIEG